MRAQHRISILLSVLLVAGLGASPAFSQQDMTPVPPVPESPRTAEQVLGFMIDDIGISFQVETSGCTSKADFRVKLTWAEPRHLDLIRVRPDPCDAVIPYGTRIFFSWEEMGLKLGDWWEIGNRLHSPLAAPLDIPISDPQEGDQLGDGARAECILGFRVHNEGITYRVSNDGCAEPADFMVHRLTTNPNHLVLIRKNKGTCTDGEFAPTWIDVTFSWKKLGLRPAQKFEIGNHILREGYCRLYAF